MVAPVPNGPRPRSLSLGADPPAGSLPLQGLAKPPPGIAPGPVGHVAAGAVQNPDPSNPTGFVLAKLKSENPNLDDAQLLAQISNVEITPRTTASKEGSGLLFHSYEHPTGSGNRFVKSEVVVRCTITKPDGQTENVEHPLDMFTAVKWPTNEGERRAASEKLGRIAKGYCHFHTNVLDSTKRAATAGLAQKVADIAAGGAVRVASPHGPRNKEPLSAVHLTWGKTLESTEVTITQRVDGLRHIINDQAGRTVEMGTVAPTEAGAKAIGSYVRETDSHLVRRDEFHDSSDPYLMLKAKGSGIQLADFGGDDAAVQTHAERLLEEIQADGAQAEETAQRMLTRQEPGRIGKLLKRTATWEQAAVFKVFKGKQEELTKAQAKLVKLRTKLPEDNEKVIAQQIEVTKLDKEVSKTRQEFEGALPILRSAHRAQQFKIAQLDKLWNQSGGKDPLQESLSAALTEARATAKQTQAMMDKISKLTRAEEATPVTSNSAEGVGLLLSEITGSLTAAQSARERFDAARAIADAACTKFDQFDAQYRKYRADEHNEEARKLYDQQFEKVTAKARATQEAAERGWKDAHSVLLTLETQIKQLEDLHPPAGTPAHTQLTKAKTAAADFQTKLFAEYGSGEQHGPMAGLDVSGAIASLKTRHQGIPVTPPAAQQAAAMTAEELTEAAAGKRAARIATPPVGSLEETAQKTHLLKATIGEMERSILTMQQQMLEAGDKYRELEALHAQIEAHLKAQPPQTGEALNLYEEQFDSLCKPATDAYSKAYKTYRATRKLHKKAQNLNTSLAAVADNPFAGEARALSAKFTTQIGAFSRAYWRDHSPGSPQNINFIGLNPQPLIQSMTDKRPSKP